MRLISWCDRAKRWRCEHIHIHTCPIVSLPLISLQTFFNNKINFISISSMFALL